MENFNMKSLNHTDNIGGGAAIGGGGTADEPPINFEIKKLIDKIITYSTSIPSEREEKGERERGITLIFLFAGNANRNEKQVLQNLINKKIKIKDVYFVDTYYQCRSAFENQIAEARAKGVAGPRRLMFGADNTPTKLVTDLLDNNNIHYYCNTFEDMAMHLIYRIPEYTMVIAINLHNTRKSIGFSLVLL